ncbi:MAG: DUF5687 family protein [Saprospiraceae bacterium]|nr:DUF5687 family protein [Saprospiraceae bacterium]
MFGKITQLSIKSFLRSPAFSQNLSTTLMMVFVGLYFGLSMVVLGAAAPFAVEKLAPDVNPSAVIGKYFMYTILYFTLTRLIFQNFGFKELKQYILQPIKKTKIYHYVLTKTAFHWINWITLLGIIAYLTSAHLNPEYNVKVLNHAFVMIGLLFTSNYLAFIIDKQLSLNKLVTGGLIAGLLIINFLDVQGYLPLGVFFENSFVFLTSNIGFALIPVLTMVACYYFSFTILSKIVYLEDSASDNSITEVNIHSGLFSKFGRAGEMMEMELKLIVRNKRSKNMMYVIFLIFLYPLMSEIESYQGMGWYMFIAIFTTGGFALTYGQLLLSWNSGHFDLLLTKMESIKEIFRAKYYLQCMIIIAQTMLLILYGFYKTEYFLLMPAMMFYNLGFVLFLYMLLASYNSKKVDSNKGDAMNYEGFSVALFLIIIPIMIVPIVLYHGCKYMGYPDLGIYITAFIGLIGFIFHDKLIDISVALFKKNRYKIGTAFRSK